MNGRKLWIASILFLALSATARAEEEIPGVGTKSGNRSAGTAADQAKTLAVKYENAKAALGNAFSSVKLPKGANAPKPAGKTTFLLKNGHSVEDAKIAEEDEKGYWVDLAGGVRVYLEKSEIKEIGGKR